MKRGAEPKTRRGVTDSEIGDAVADLDELRSLMADFTPEQRAAVLDAASQAALHARARVLADRVLAECPPAPGCTSWCTADHEQVKGWGDVERHGETKPPMSVEKTCSTNVGLAQTDGGSIMVSLERLAASDYVVGRWDPVFIGDSFVNLHPDDEFSRVTVDQLDALQGLLSTARQLLSGAER